MFGKKTTARLKMDSAQRFAESYNTAAINLNLSLKKESCKIIALSSSGSNAEKAGNAFHLASALAKQGSRKVLLVDCNFRWPVIHTLCETTVSPGLCDYLSGVAPLDKVLHQRKDGLHVLCAGANSWHPLKLLSCEKFDKMLQQLSDSYDFIVMDTPPANLVSDALIVAAKCDGVLLSVVHNQTRHADLEKMIEQYHRLDVNILGLIANDGLS